MLSRYHPLSRWPFQLSTAQEVKVQMIDGLSALHAAIHDDPISICGQTQVTCNLLDGQHDVSHDRLVFGTQMLQRSNFLLGNYEYMDRRLGGHIMEGQAMFILVSDIRRYFAIDDLFEDCFLSHLILSCSARD